MSPNTASHSPTTFARSGGYNVSRIAALTANVRLTVHKTTRVALKTLLHQIKPSFRLRRAPRRPQRRSTTEVSTLALPMEGRQRMERVLRDRSDRPFSLG